MKREFNIVTEQGEDVFVANVPELRGCYTQAKSLDVLIKRIREATELYLEVEEIEVNSPRFIGIQRMTIEV